MSALTNGRMERIWIFCCLVAFLLLPGSQSHAVSRSDSLQTELDKHSLHDTAYVKHLLAAQDAIRWADPERAKLWSREALQLSTQLEDQFLMLKSLYALGASFTVVSESDSALEYLFREKELAGNLGEGEWMARGDIVIAVNYNGMGEYHKALTHNFSARRFFNLQGDQLQLTRISNNIANIYMELQRWDDALDYYKQALVAAKSAENRHLESVASGNIGNLLRQMERKEEAFPYLLAAYRINTEFGISNGHAPLCYNLGHHYLDLGELSKARQFLEEALDFSKRTVDPKSEAETRIYLARYYERKGQIGEAKASLDSAFAVANGISSDMTMVEVYRAFYEFHKGQGNSAEALEAYENYKYLSDSINNFEKERQIKILEDEYALETREQQIMMLEAEAEVQDRFVRRQNLILTGLAAALALVLVLMGLVYRSNLRRKTYNSILKRRSELIESQRQEILGRNEELSRKNIRLETLNNEIEGLVAIVAHDLKAPLTSTEAMLDMLGQDDLPPAMRSKITGMVRNSTQKGRELIEDILTISRMEWGQPDLKLAEVDLGEVVGETAEAFRAAAEEKSIDLQVKLAQNTNLFPTERISLERILENLISNAIKFSPPKLRVWVVLEKGENEYQIRIKDEGPGISEEDQARMFRKFQRLSAQPTAGESSTGLGLSIVKALTERLGGQLEVRSKLGEGAEFVISLPHRS